MAKRALYRKSVLTPGVGSHMYLMFVGRRHDIDLPGMPASSDGNKLRLGTCLVVGTALLLGIVLWFRIRSIF